MAVPAATTTARKKWCTREYIRDGPERTVTLRHGDALLLNFEKIAHSVKVLSTCVNERAKLLLSDRRICVPIRPKADAAYETSHAAWRKEHGYS
jgi:hypothetical protein